MNCASSVFHSRNINPVEEYTLFYRLKILVTQIKNFFDFSIGTKSGEEDDDVGLENFHFFCNDIEIFALDFANLCSGFTATFTKVSASAAYF